jgi:hypothetical protein
VGTGLLSLASEDGVPATNVCDYGVSTASLVTKRHAMVLAGAAAVPVRGAGREKTAEHAVLGVENRKMPIGYGLDTLGADVASERGNLRGVEIVCGSQSCEAKVQVRFCC